MNTRTVSTILITVALSVACAVHSPLSSGKWLDLTHTFSSDTIYWPTANEFTLETEFSGVTPKGFYYEANRFGASEHGGTHIDAPIHFAQGRHTVDQIAVAEMIGEAAVIDVSKKSLTNRDYQIHVEDILEWEKKNGKIPKRAILLFHTGSGRFWPNRNKYMGTSERGKNAVPKLHFPGLHPMAARWLLKNRNILAVGLDTPSIDYGQSNLFETHQILFKKNIPAFENVANLEKLPATGATVIALPMKIKGGSGAPLRIVALVP